MKLCRGRNPGAGGRRGEAGDKWRGARHTFLLGVKICYRSTFWGNEPKKYHRNYLSVNFFLDWSSYRGKNLSVPRQSNQILVHFTVFSGKFPTNTPIIFVWESPRVGINQLARTNKFTNGCYPGGQKIHFNLQVPDKRMCLNHFYIVSFLGLGVNVSFWLEKGQNLKGLFHIPLPNTTFRRYPWGKETDPHFRNESFI